MKATHSIFSIHTDPGGSDSHLLSAKPASPPKARSSLHLPSVPSPSAAFICRLYPCLACVTSGRLYTAYVASELSDQGRLILLCLCLFVFQSPFTILSPALTLVPGLPTCSQTCRQAACIGKVQCRQEVSRCIQYRQKGCSFPLPFSAPCLTHSIPSTHFVFTYSPAPWTQNMSLLLSTRNLGPPDMIASKSK